MWSLPGRELLWSRDDVPTSWLAISPDGRYLATVGNTFKDGAPDGDPVTSTFTVWNLSTQAVHLAEDFTDIEYQPEGGVTYTSQTTPVLRTVVVFAPERNRLAIAYIDGFVMIYDVALRRRTSGLETYGPQVAKTYGPARTFPATSAPSPIALINLQRLRSPFLVGNAVIASSCGGVVQGTLVWFDGPLRIDRYRTGRLPGAAVGEACRGAPAERTHPHRGRWDHRRDGRGCRCH